MARTATVVAVLTLATACGPAPCTHCPPVEGSYSLIFAAPQMSPDTVCSQSNLMADFWSTLIITRSGSALQATGGALVLHGQLSDDGAFALDNGSATNTVSISAQFTAPITLNGTWNAAASVDTGSGGPRTMNSDSAAPLCTMTASFHGIKPAP